MRSAPALVDGRQGTASGEKPSRSERFGYASRVLTPFLDREWLTAHTLLALFALATYVVASLARRQHRHPSAAIAWVVALGLMPYLALPLFLMFGMRKIVRAPRRQPRWDAQAQAARQATAGGRLQALAVGLGMPPPEPYEQLVIHQDGEQALQRLREVLSGARRTIDLSTFLVGRDPVGKEICELLARRAREGVRVRLMVDGVGRYLGGAPRLDRLKAAGVQVRLFASPWAAPLMGGGRTNLRNHRKIVLADGEWLWTGGRNIAAEYFVAQASHGHIKRAWTDLTFDLRGPLALEVGRRFDLDWRAAIRASAGEVRPGAADPGAPPDAPSGQLLASGPDQSDDTVHSLLVDAIFNARRRVLATTPYFVPDAVLLMALALAARRGIEVDLIVPARSNHRMADLARPASLRELMDAGGRVWFTPSMLHGKLVIVDETVAFSGSLNLDQRSLFLNYELMIAFYEPQAIAGFAQWAQGARATARRAQPSHVSVWREFGEGLLRWLTFQL